MSSLLPFTVQDDLKQKEKYATATQQKSSSRNCSSRRIRLWTIILIISLSSLGLVTYFNKSNTAANYISYFGGDDDVHSFLSPAETAAIDESFANNQEKEEPISLKDEILSHIQNHQLIVFSKTYCPFSMKAKRILSSYNLKETLNVIEVNLRDDDYQVKMVLKEISGRETFPNIFLNGKSIGGSDNLEELHETGQLQLLLTENQLLLN